MATCVVPDCAGHILLARAVLHGQQHIIAQLNRIQLAEETVMADDVDRLAADFEQFHTDVSTAVDELKTELANALAGGIPPAVQAKLDAIDASINAADESLATPPAPTPPAGP